MAQWQAFRQQNIGDSGMLTMKDKGRNQQQKWIAKLNTFQVDEWRARDNGYNFEPVYSSISPSQEDM